MNICTNYGCDFSNENMYKGKYLKIKTRKQIKENESKKREMKNNHLGGTDRK